MTSLIAPLSDRELPRAAAARTMCEAFQITAAAYADRLALRTLADATSINWARYAALVRELAAGLDGLGVRRGDRVALMLTNRPEFHLLDSAAMHLGATAFSIYNTLAPEQIAHLLRDAEPKALITEPAFLERVRAAMELSARTQLILVEGEAPDALSSADLAARGRENDGFDFDAAWRAVQPSDVLTLIYTSGTTGPPKGVQLTHANEMAQCRGLLVAEPSLAESTDTVSYLPAAHIADRGLSHYGQMVIGDAVTTCPDLSAVFAHVADCRPTRFGAVPRVWEKLKAALEAGQAEAVAAAQRDPEAAAALRAKLGFDRCQWYVIGAAPAPLELFEFFASLGVTICEVWGMSELSSIATLVRRSDPRFGTVGKPLPGVELRLAQDGELLVRGETVMAGYRNLPELTAETIDAEGWLHTGDIGALDEDGFLRIIDRKKELIINSAGKNMSPANIEQQLKMGSALIGQACVIGDRRPYNVALIVLDPDACRAFAARAGLADDSLAAMAAAPAVQAEVEAGVRRANSHLSRVEQIKRWAILGVDWPPAGDELTPTMKLKRRPIAAKYADQIEALYKDGSP